MAKNNTFDRSLKVIARNHAELFVRLALPNVPLTLVEQQENVELSLPVQPVDFVHRMLYTGKATGEAGQAEQASPQEYLLHLEFQLDHFDDFPRRMCHVHGSLTQQFRLPVLSIVIYLKRREKTMPTAYVVELDGIPINRFTYPVIQLWEYVDRIRSGEFRELAPLLVVLEETPDEETLRVERELILAEPDQEKRADLLSIAATLASRIFDREFLRWFFREELTQMQHATLIDEWLDEAVQKALEEAVPKAEKKAAEEAAIQAKLEQATTSILRIVAVRFGVTEEQQTHLHRKLQQVSDVELLNITEEFALRSFTFVDFNARVDELLQTQPTNGSAQ